MTRYCTKCGGPYIWMNVDGVCVYCVRAELIYLRGVEEAVCSFVLEFSKEKGTTPSAEAANFWRMKGELAVEPLSIMYNLIADALGKASDVLANSQADRTRTGLMGDDVTELLEKTTWPEEEMTADD